jgi:hypothetical protein
MSYHVFFAFSTGLKSPLQVPAGTKARILAHVEGVEETLGLKRTKYKDNPVHWDSFDAEWRAGWPSVDDKTLCETIEEHNDFVRRLYHSIARWSKEPVEGGEILTPEDAAEFWHGLSLLSVPPNRWTKDYYRSRMEALYEVMRGREAEGITFDEKALTPKQAGAVIRLFSQFLDPQDLQLEVIAGQDRLGSSYYGDYDWCEKCGQAMDPDDGAYCRKRKCPLAAAAKEE